MNQTKKCRQSHSYIQYIYIYMCDKRSVKPGRLMSSKVCYTKLFYWDSAETGAMFCV